MRVRALLACRNKFSLGFSTDTLPSFDCNRSGPGISCCSTRWSFIIESIACLDLWRASFFRARSSLAKRFFLSLFDSPGMIGYGFWACLLCDLSRARRSLASRLRLSRRVSFIMSALPIRKKKLFGGTKCTKIFSCLFWVCHKTNLTTTVKNFFGRPLAGLFFRKNKVSKGRCSEANDSQCVNEHLS